MQEYVMTFFKCMVAAAPFVAAGVLIWCIVSIIKTILSIRRTRRIAKEFDTFEVADGEIDKGDAVSLTPDGKIERYRG